MHKEASSFLAWIPLILSSRPLPTAHLSLPSSARILSPGPRFFHPPAVLLAPHGHTLARRDAPTLPTASHVPLHGTSLRLEERAGRLLPLPRWFQGPLPWAASRSLGDPEPNRVQRPFHQCRRGGIEAAPNVCGANVEEEQPQDEEERPRVPSAKGEGTRTEAGRKAGTEAECGGEQGACWNGRAVALGTTVSKMACEGGFGTSGN